MPAIPGYEITESIYESIRTQVYRTRRIEEGAPVILKAPSGEYPTAEEMERYRHEYDICRSLSVREGVPSCRLEKHRNAPLLVFEDFGGESLRGLMKSKQLSLSETLRIGAQAAQILARIHLAGIMHKDINPSNLILNPQTGRVAIIDFGLAEAFGQEEQAIESSDGSEGTAAYMSPEQTGRMNRPVDYRTDFYSLGVTLYELLTGRLPFEATDLLELVHCHIAKEPVPPHEIDPRIPEVLSGIVMKLMSKDAEDRYRSGWGIGADLEECLERLEAHGRIDPFPTGRADVADLFRDCHKLYGRDKEVQALLAALDRVSMGRKELMLVIGSAGIGKSSVVGEIHGPVTLRKGYFLSGKFDQFQGNIPYSALVDAFEELVRQLLTESSEVLARRRKDLLAALGSNGALITNIIPELELIIGPQPPVQELGPEKSRNRFQLVFESFIRAFCRPDQPLVIFLDDLQWMDPATIRLIEIMTADEEARFLLLIGAYRDNEVEVGHPLLMAMDRLRAKGAAISRIHLDPLEPEHVSKWIGDILYTDSVAVSPLAELVARKTGGNPFFIGQFLRILNSEGLIAFNVAAKCRQWDLDRIVSMGITDNVVDLMTHRLTKLPENTRRALSLAATIGNRSDLALLSHELVLSLCMERAQVEYLNGRFETLISLILT